MRMDVVILAGGSGERFWPLSRSCRPKQVLSLIGEESLLEDTLRRARFLPTDDGDERQVWILAARRQQDALESLDLDIDPGQIVYEPMAKNTAPAIAAATELMLADARAEGDSDRLMLVCPSDHHVPDTKAFWSTVEVAAEVALRERQLVTFGLTVTRPETGYGYIERGEALSGFSSPAFRVQRFHEKPDQENARSYQKSGSFYWNAGIFVFSALHMREELCRHVPELAGPLDALGGELLERRKSKEVIEPAIWERFFEAAPSISVDYGVFEPSDDVAVVPASFPWSDLGGWTSWSEYQEEDARGNRTAGAVLSVDAKRNTVYSEDGGLVALLGVQDLIVVRVGDATLVCPRDKAQEIRQLVREGKIDASFARFF